MSLLDRLLQPQYNGLMQALYGGPVGGISITPSVFNSPNPTGQFAANTAAGLYNPDSNGAPYSGGLIGNAAQGQAMSQVSPSVALPVLQNLLAFQNNPEAQAELTGKQLSNKAAALNLIPLQRQTQAWEGITGQQPDIGAIAPPASNANMPAGPAGEQDENGFPLSRKLPVSGLPPGIDLRTATLLGPQGLASTLEKFAGPQKLSPGESLDYYNFGTGGVGNLASLPKLAPVNGQLVDESNPANIGRTIPKQPEPALPPAVFNQQVALQAAKTGAEQQAKQNVPLLPANNPQVQAYLPNVLNGTFNPRNVPEELRASVANAINQLAPNQFVPSAAQAWTTTSRAITDQYTKLAPYELTANGSPYLARIEAAMQKPGSVSDQDLLDSITKLNTSGNAISDEQVRLITEGQSYKDALGVWENRLKNGGVLSPNQRQQIQQLAQATYGNYQKQYQPIYEKATQQLQSANVPKAFWTIPDLNNLSRTGAALGMNSGDLLSQARSAIAAGKSRSAVIGRLKQLGVDPGGL